MSTAKRTCRKRRAVHEKPIADPDLINSLNDDCLGRIFQFLPLGDRFRITGVCKRWNAAELSKHAWGNTKSLKFGKIYPIRLWDKPTDLQQLPLEARSPEGIARVLEKCGHRLERLYFTTKVDGRILPDIAKYCQNLVALQIICDWTHWEANIFFPKLQSLHMAGRTPSDGLVPEEFFQALPLTIVDLTLEATDVGEWPSLPRAALTAFESLRKLSHIKLHRFNLDPETMKIISQKSTLQEIDLFCCLKDGLPPFTSLTNLEHLSLIGMEVKDRTLLEISDACRELKYLNFISENVTDLGISSLAFLTKLEYLSIDKGKGVTDNSLTGLHNLKHLLCANCLNVRDNGIIELIRYASNLQTLDLTGTRVTRRVLQKANEIIMERTNKIPLLLIINRHIRDSWVIDKRPTTPLLRVLGVDYVTNNNVRR